ncbi:hypothetical protein U0070_003845 [Myodes glareolus]|uniref:Uncharacterized protein n=1 Tax=Myodes glareolus TaxID=447135 RepID=A0AAW0H9U4_MYOGA
MSFGHLRSPQLETREFGGNPYERDINPWELLVRQTRHSVSSDMDHLMNSLEVQLNSERGSMQAFKQVSFGS